LALTIAKQNPAERRPGGLCKADPNYLDITLAVVRYFREQEGISMGQFSDAFQGGQRNKEEQLRASELQKTHEEKKIKAEIAAAEKWIAENVRTVVEAANVDLAQIDLQVTIETKTSSPSVTKTSSPVTKTSGPSVRTQLTIRNTRTTDQPKHTVTFAINKDGAIILHRDVRGDRAGSNFGTIRNTDASRVKQILLQVLEEIGSGTAAGD
jgi:hypothetical protein